MDDRTPQQSPATGRAGAPGNLDRASHGPASKAAAVRWLMPFVRLCPTEVERDEFLKRISLRLDVSLEALRRDGRVEEAPPPVPLEPDAFAAWAWEQGPRAKGTSPFTVDDLAFELGLPREEIEADFTRLAARVRANQERGAGPWEGIR